MRHINLIFAITPTYVRVYECNVKYFLFVLLYEININLHLNQMQINCDPIFDFRFCVSALHIYIYTYLLKYFMHCIFVLCTLLLSTRINRSISANSKYNMWSAHFDVSLESQHCLLLLNVK